MQSKPWREAVATPFSTAPPNMPATNSIWATEVWAARRIACRIPLAKPVRMKLWRPDGRPARSCLVVGVEELCAGKLCALVSRVLPRDCHDVMRLPALVGSAWGLRVRRLFIALAGALPYPLYTYRRARLSAVTQRDVVAHLYPMLAKSDRPAASTLRARTWRVLGRFMKLSAEEREYSRLIQRGDLRPELLFPRDRAMAERLRNHPVLLWKVENARHRLRS